MNFYAGELGYDLDDEEPLPPCITPDGLHDFVAVGRHTDRCTQCELHVVVPSEAESVQPRELRDDAGDAHSGELAGKGGAS